MYGRVILLCSSGVCSSNQRPTPFHPALCTFRPTFKRCKAFPKSILYLIKKTKKKPAQRESSSGAGPKLILLVQRRFGEIRINFLLQLFDALKFHRPAYAVLLFHIATCSGLWHKITIQILHIAAQYIKSKIVFLLCILCLHWWHSCVTVVVKGWG